MATSGTDQQIGASFDHFERAISAVLIVASSSEAALLKLFRSLSSSPEADTGESERFIRVLIAPEANGCTFAPGFPLGDQSSRGHQPRYGKTPPSGQRAPVSPADLPAQRVQARIPRAVSQPALLSGSGMLARSPPLACGAAKGQTPQGRPRQNQARPEGESCAAS